MFPRNKCYQHAKWRLSAGGWDMPGIFAQCLIPQGQCKEKKIDIKDKADRQGDESSRYLVRYCEKLGPGLKRGCRVIVARGPVCLFKYRDYPLSSYICAMGHKLPRNTRIPPYILLISREVRKRKNCAPVLENGLWRGPYSRPRAPFFPYTDRPLLFFLR